MSEKKGASTVKLLSATQQGQLESEINGLLACGGELVSVYGNGQYHFAAVKLPGDFVAAKVQESKKPKLAEVKAARAAALKAKKGAK